MIKAAQVKELRELTGAGILDAKTALTETGGDIEAATDWLRAKGMSKAAKKSSRETAEGLVGVRVDGNSGILIEVNSETDFVAKNENFTKFVRLLLEISVEADDVDGLLSMEWEGSRVSEMLAQQVAKIGENLSVSKLGKISGENLASYVHKSVADNLGKIGVILAYENIPSDGAGDMDQFQTARMIAMHIAAINPIGVTSEDVPADVIDRERQILKQKAIDSGKPDFIAEKIVEGGLKKFLAEQTLLEQKFVADTSMTVAEAAAEASIRLNGFIRYKVGEAA